MADLALVETDVIQEALDLLTYEEQQIVLWMVTTPPEKEKREGLLDLCERIQRDKATVYRAMKRPKVQEAYSRCLRASIQAESVPDILHSVFEKAKKDAKFGLDVLKWLQGEGFDVLGRSDGKNNPSEGGGSVTLTLPGGYDAMVRTRKAGND